MAYALLKPSNQEGSLEHIQDGSRAVVCSLAVIQRGLVQRALKKRILLMPCSVVQLLATGSAHVLCRGSRLSHFIMETK